MTNKLQELYETHILMGMRKQRHLAQLIGAHTWHYEKAAGTMAFSPGPTYQVQVLGTEAADSETWLWAWANEASQIPAEQLQASQQLRSLGEELGIEEFTTPELPREKLPAHTLGPVVLGLLGLPAYYRGAMDTTNLLVAIADPKYTAPLELKGTDFIATLGWSPNWQGDTLEVAASDGVRESEAVVVGLAERVAAQVSNLVATAASSALAAAHFLINRMLSSPGLPRE